MSAFLSEKSSRRILLRKSYATRADVSRETEQFSKISSQKIIVKWWSKELRERELSPAANGRKQQSGKG